MGGNKSDGSSTDVLARSTAGAREVGRGPSSDRSPLDAVGELQARIDVLTAFTRGLIIELDREGRYLRVWAGDERLLVRPIEELVGRTVAEVLGPSCVRFHGDFRAVFDSGIPLKFDYSLDVPAGRHSFSCEIRPHDPRGGGTRTLTLSIVDVTAAKALEAKLLQAQRLGALGLLSASVGHEIRQPLSDVSTSLDVLERSLAGVALPGEAQLAMENIRSGARRIGEIASSLDLLAAQRPRSNRRIDVRRPLLAALDLCASAITRLEVQRAVGEMPPVIGDEGELCQVFANLMLNAAQAIPEGGSGPKRLSITGTTSGDRIRVTVTDTGSGIPAEQLEHIFDPFFTTKGKGGTGLGLFITRGIVEAHGGMLSVESEIGCGTTVDVYLPIAKPARIQDEPTTGLPPASMRTARGARTALTAPATPTGRTTRDRLKLLLIDDEPRFLDSLRLALDDAHEVDTRTKASEALALLEKEPLRYDVVLCDLSMPEVDGVAFYERMQAMGIAERFILMTGGAFTTRATEFIARNACPNIGKPFLLERLLTLIDEVSRNRRAS